MLSAKTRHSGRCGLRRPHAPGRVPAPSPRQGASPPAPEQGLRPFDGLGSFRSGTMRWPVPASPPSSAGFVHRVRKALAYKRGTPLGAFAMLYTPLKGRPSPPYEAHISFCSLPLFLIRHRPFRPSAKPNTNPTEDGEDTGTGQRSAPPPAPSAQTLPLPSRHRRRRCPGAGGGAPCRGEGAAPLSRGCRQASGGLSLRGSVSRPETLRISASIRLRLTSSLPKAPGGAPRSGARRVISCLLLGAG